MKEIYDYFLNSEGLVLNGCTLDYVITNNFGIALHFKVKETTEIVYIRQESNSKVLMIWNTETGEEYMTTKDGLGIWVVEITKNMYNRHMPKVKDGLYNLDWRG